MDGNKLMSANFLWGIVIAILVLWLVSIYNSFVQLTFRVKEALSDIDVQLKRRYDLIPNLIETVKGYLAHEQRVLEEVTEARSRVAGAGNSNPVERAEAENTLSKTLKTLFAVSENYPDLKADSHFLELQRELSDTENKIQAARRFYNSTVLELNSKIDSFPENIIASIFRFSKEKFFEAEEGEREVIKVKF